MHIITYGSYTDSDSSITIWPRKNKSVKRDEADETQLGPHTDHKH